MNKIYDLMFSLIRREICEELTEIDLSDISEEQYQELFKLAKLHDIAHIIGSALSSCQGVGISSEIKTKLHKKQMSAIYRYAQISHEYDLICGALNDAEIPFIPLKGSIIRNYYKKPEMRTSCDIDIFVNEENLDRATLALSEKLGYSIGEKDVYDVTLQAQTGLHVELHFALTYENPKAEEYLKSVWDWTEPEKTQPFHYTMNNEMFVFYHIVHMAKHFISGGCGVKPFIDLWIAKNKMTYDYGTVMKMLTECDLDAFGENVILLSKIWFSDAEYTSLTKEIEQYIIEAGVYGTLESKVAIDQNKSGGRIGYALKRIFHPYSKMKQYYPILNKYPILFPFLQVVRWFRIVFSKERKKAFSELKYNSSMADDKMNRLYDMRNRLKL